MIYSVDSVIQPLNNRGQILALLLRATGSVSSGNLSAFEVIGSNAREIAGDYINTTGNKESCPLQHRNFKSKTSLPKLRPALLNW